MAERPSSIDRLPDEVRAEIGRLRQNGRTIDEILTHLRKLDGIEPVSRSALGRHIKGLAKLGERMRRSRQVAEALVKDLGDAPESEAARINIELMHTAILDLFMRADGDGEEGGAAPADPKSLHDVSKALDHLARASKTNMDFIAAAEKRATDKAKAAAAEKVDEVGRARGISAETLTAIKAGIFGVRPETRTP